MRGCEARPQGPKEAIKRGLAEALKGATPLEAQIVSTNYLSFQYSMGDPVLQRLLIYLTRPYYDAKAFRQEFPTVSALDQAIQPRLARLYLPGYHKAITNDGEVFTKEKVTDAFNKNWAFHRKVLSGIEGVNDDMTHDSLDDLRIEVYGGKTREEVLIEAASDMVIRDRRYVSGGRPGGGNGDSQESFVRSFVMQGQSLTSEGIDSSLFDAVCRELKTTIEKVESMDRRDYKGEHYAVFSQLKEAYPSLKFVWEKTHAPRRWNE